MSIAAQIELRYFGQLAELVGKSSETLELGEVGAISSLSALRAFLAGRDEQWQKAFDHSAQLCAINQKIVHHDAALKPGDEVAFFPQVTGG